MDKIKQLLQKYRGVIAYLIFGVLTTVINVIAYQLCYNVAGIPNVVSTIIAWVLAVLFAFITNKLFVFNSKSFARDVVLREMVNFFGCRLLTGLLDVLIMYVAVDVLGWHALLWKILSNGLVIVLNYIASKLFIFKNSDWNNTENTKEE